jgi:hypothetical protein
VARIPKGPAAPGAARISLLTYKSSLAVYLPEEFKNPVLKSASLGLLVPLL